MQFGVSNIGWDIDKSELMFQTLSKMDISNIEVAPTKVCSWDDTNLFNKLKEYKYLAQSNGINICGLQSIYYTKPFNVFRDVEFIEHFKLVIEVSKFLGASYIVYGSPKTRFISSQDDPNRFIDIFSELSNISGDVNICIEPNPTLYGCNFITNVKEGFDIVSKINKSNVKLHIDTSEIIINNERIEDIDTTFSRTCHISNPGLSKISSDYSDIYNNVFDLDLDFITLESMDCNSIESLIEQLSYIEKIKK